MEILYIMESIDSLQRFAPERNIRIKWLLDDEDHSVFCHHLEAQQGRTVNAAKWKEWLEHGITYCGLFKDGEMVARAAVERIQDDTWETCDVRVSRGERGKGYAKQICTFVTAYILESGKYATCRTEEDNFAMQRVIKSLGFKELTR